MKFDFQEYKGKHVMCCQSQEEADDFCELMNANGKRWNGGKSYIEDTRWSAYEKEMCYDFNEGRYSPRRWFKEKGYTILYWEDFMKNTLCNGCKNTTGCEKCCFNKTKEE